MVSAEELCYNLAGERRQIPRCKQRGIKLAAGIEPDPEYQWKRSPRPGLVISHFFAASETEIKERSPG